MQIYMQQQLSDTPYIARVSGVSFLEQCQNVIVATLGYTLTFNTHCLPTQAHRLNTKLTKLKPSIAQKNATMG